MAHPVASPFLRMDSERWDDIVTDATVELIRARGLRGVTLTAIARWVTCSPGALGNRFGGGDLGALHRMLCLATVCFADRWLAWACYVTPGDPLDEAVHEAPGRVPLTDEERFGVRVWHAFHELARGLAAEGVDAAQQALDAAHADERALVRRRLPPASRTDDVLDDVLAALDGLRWAATVTPETVTPDSSRRLLTPLLRAPGVGTRE